MNKMKVKYLIYFLIPIFIACNHNNGKNTLKENGYSGNEITKLKTKLAKGWNTWNTRSVLSHVLLPEGFALNLQIKDSGSGDILKEALIGRDDYGAKERVIPGPRSYDGSYTELKIEWRDIHILVQSASDNNELYLLITPIKASSGDSLIVDPQMLWDREGEIIIDQNAITAQTPLGTTRVYVNGNQSPTTSQNVRVSLDKVIAISTEATKPLKEITKVINDAKKNLLSKRSKFQKTPELYNAMHSVLAWNCIYDPNNNRIITPVSRNWNVSFNGWVLFEWDTYFASYMLSLDNKELAYANAIAITKEITDRGVVPNFAQPVLKSEDRSEPPVGAFVVREIYKNHKEKWLLHEVFEELLRWNRWWADQRDIDGYLCWGSDPYDPGKISDFLRKGIGTKKGAKWESGLDNSPMYDDAVFDTATHRLMMADVGLMSLYILDCQSLSEIACVLGKTDIKHELTERAEKYSKKLETLWNDEFGLYLNKDLITGKFSYRLSPTLFYPLLAKVPSQEQAIRMIKEHFYNPDEFWGEFIIPSISRNDPAFHDNYYWRGRIWAPMNFLVYLGIRNYKLPDAQKDMVERSKKLLLKSWLGENHVYENYNAITGQGNDAGGSDAFYTWGALLGYIGMIDQGYVQPPELSLCIQNK